jgi:phosphatidylglycerol:prolipoprotein diacylglycerol transferase
MGMMTLGISMGQWLSLPMVIAGILMLSWIYRKRPAPFQEQVHRAEPGRPAASGKSPALKKRNRK